MGLMAADNTRGCTDMVTRSSFVRKCFNMVEVTLAIATVGIGVAGVMSMFPVAIRSSRDAVAQNYCADCVDQLISVVSNLAQHESVWGAGSYVDSIPSSTSFAANIINEGSAYPAGTKAGNIYFPSANPLGGVAVMAAGATDTSGNLTTPDFVAGLRFWKEPIHDLFLAGQSFDFAGLSNPYAYGFTLHIEVSWPLAKPYALREKRYYSYELFNAEKI